jgi:hypothetical protein
MWLEYHHELTAYREAQTLGHLQYSWPPRPAEPVPERHWRKPRWGVAAALETTPHEQAYYAKKRARVPGMSTEDLDDICHAHGIPSGQAPAGPRHYLLKDDGRRCRCGSSTKPQVYELPRIASLAAYWARERIERALAKLSELPPEQRQAELDRVGQERRRCIWRGSERLAA